MVAGACAAIAVVLAACVQVVMERDNQLRLWRDVAEADARSIAAHAHQTVHAADTLVRVVRDRLEESLPRTAPLEAVAGTQEFHDFLRDRKRSSPGLAMLSVANADGVIVSFSHAFPPRDRVGRAIDVSGSAFFRALRAEDSRSLAVGHPARNHVDGQWSFHIAHPLRAGDGTLRGVVFAGVDLVTFAGAYGGLAMQGKSFRLFHADGTYMFRGPEGQDDQIGADYSDSASMRTFRSGAASRVFERGERARNEESAGDLRIVAPVAVGNYPLVVSVRLDETLVLAAWKRSAATTGLLAALLATLLVSGGAAVRLYLLRRAVTAGHLAASAERIRRQEADTRRLALIAQRTDNAVILTDREGCITWVNDGFTRITGYAADEAIGRRPGTLLQGAQSDPLTRERMRARLASGDGFKEEILNYGHDGRPYWLAIEVQPMQGKGGAVEGFMAIERDVTAERVALDNLHLQNAASDLLVGADSLQVALPGLLRMLAERGGWRVVQAWARDGEHLVWRAGCESPGPVSARFSAASRACRFTKGEGAPGRAWERAVPEAQADYGADASDSRCFAARDDGLVDGWCVPVYAEGELQGVLELAGRRVQTRDPALADTLAALGGMFGQFLARRIAGRRMRAALAQAEGATLAKTRFIATVSHEIRTPLNAVVGLASLMAGDAMEPESRAKVDILREAADQLLAVVNDVLDLSRLEADRMASVRAAFGLRGLLRQAVRIARTLPGAAALDIGYRIDDGVPERFFGDEQRLSQVLLNLLGNAVKFAPRGRVELSVRAHPADGERWSVTFAVRDSGVGIPPDYLQRIFEPFEQVPREGAHSRGTGLGLAICRRIATHLGGTLEVSSTVGEGSEFRLAVPLECAAASEAPQAPSRERQAPGGLRVLLAEDTPASQLVARMILERLGHEVIAVSDGDDAVRAATEHPFDVVFLDIQMPRMSGFAAARAIRQLGDIGRRLRIVGLSAMAQDADREQAMSAGMDLYLTKPVRLEDVERALAAVAA